MDSYETYLRTRDGETYHPKNIQEAVKQFLSDDGYRISFNIEGVVFTIRRDMRVDSDMQFLDRELGSDSLDCTVTIRGHK